MNRTGILYLDLTWNPVVGCGNGCTYCWARRMARRGKNRCAKCGTFEPHFHPERLGEPVRRRKPARIGVSFMGDVFDPEVSKDNLSEIYAVMEVCPQHTFVVLTRQVERANEWATWFEEPLPNVWLGATVTNQADADRMLPHLLATPAALRLVSAEPLMGPLDLRPWLPGLGWTIVGGMSGPLARKHPMDPDWARAVRDQCRAAGVPFYMKQMSGGAAIPADLQIREEPDA